MERLDRIRKDLAEHKKLSKQPGGTVYIAKYVDDVEYLLSQIGPKRSDPVLPTRRDPKKKK
jgi:hypothetical protein